MQLFPQIIKFLEIDDLWEAQIKLRKEVGAKTQDALSIFGHMDDAIDSRTTIRQKDKIKSTANYIRASSRKILPIKMFMGKQLRPAYSVFSFAVFGGFIITYCLFLFVFERLGMG